MNEISVYLDVLAIIIGIIIAILVFKSESIINEEAAFIDMIYKKIDQSLFRNKKADDFFKDNLKSILFNDLNLSRKYFNRRIIVNYYYEIYKNGNSMSWLVEKDNKFYFNYSVYKNSIDNVNQDLREMMSVYCFIINKYMLLKRKTKKNISENKNIITDRKFEKDDFIRKMINADILKAEGKSLKVATVIDRKYIRIEANDVLINNVKVDVKKYELVVIKDDEKIIIDYWNGYKTDRVYSVDKELYNELSIVSSKNISVYYDVIANVLSD